MIDTPIITEMRHLRAEVERLQKENAALRTEKEYDRALLGRINRHFHWTADILSEAQSAIAGVIRNVEEMRREI